MSAVVHPVISHIALFVSDLARSTHFYREVLQFRSIEEPFRMGLHSWFQIGEGCQLHLIGSASHLPKFHINHHLAFRTASFDAFLERLVAAGIAYTDAARKENTIQLRPDGIRQVFFQDPDGYWLEMNDEPIPSAAPSV